MAKKATKTGKELERRVADAYREMGAWKVQHDVELAGNQIDVYVELETPGRLLHRIAVEAKDWTSPVGIDIVNGFAQIVKLLHSERLIDEGVIVSAAGFSRPARNAAETYDIHLLEPADLEVMVEEAKEAGRTQLVDRLTTLRVTPSGVEATLTEVKIQAMKEIGELEDQEVAKEAREKILRAESPGQVEAAQAFDYLKQPLGTPQTLKRGQEEPMNTLTWLHISDLHFRASQAYDSNIVLRALLRDVAEHVQSNGLRPDLIILSGDIAFASRSEEYALARQFLDDLLKTTGLPKDRLFLVPGNHDVDRSAISTLAAGATAILSTRDAVNRFLASDADRALVFQRFHNYQEFINEYLGKKRLPFDNAHYFYVKHIEVAGRHVAILGLNSAWLAASDEDHNRLLLGERQVRAALDAAEDADLRLAVMHHPFDWLQDFDRNDVEPLLYGGCDFVLHGHMHQVDLLQTRTPDTEAMIIAAGACYETRKYPHSYNFVQLDLSAGKGTVYLRVYSDRRGGFWTKDVVNYRNVSDGVYTFSLPARLRQSLRGIDTGTAAWDILEKYKGQRIKADSPEKLDQFFVHREKLHRIDMGAARICRSRRLPVRNLMPHEEFVLDIPALRGSDYNELAMKAVFEEIDQARAVGDSVTDTREPIAPVQRDEDQQHLRDLIAVKHRRLRELEKQAALYGITCPPHITLEIEDLRRDIADLKAQLEN